jgi:hypothetical protein
MDKKDKVLLLLAPVALVAGGYLLFGDRFTTEEAPAPQAENFSSIEAPITEIRKKRTDIYRDKYQEENGKELERNIQSDESFFGDEVKTDSATVTETPVKNVSAEEFTSAPVTDTKITEKKTEAKPKVIVKYIERPEKKEETEEKVPTALVPETKVARRRTGFVEGETTKKSEETSVGTTEEISVATVVQDDIEVKQGSNITLRTTEETTINGIKVPKNTLITGVVSLSQQRLSVDVSTIKTPSKTIAMKLKGYDLDGNEGMPLEGGVDKEIKRDVINDAINATRQVVRVPILNNTPTRAGQKKVNDPSVPVPKGYKLILKP